MLRTRGTRPDSGSAFLVAGLQVIEKCEPTHPRYHSRQLLDPTFHVDQARFAEELGLSPFGL